MQSLQLLIQYITCSVLPTGLGSEFNFSRWAKCVLVVCHCVSFYTFLCTWLHGRWHIHVHKLSSAPARPPFPSLKCQSGPLNQSPVSKQGRGAWEFKVVRQHECNFLLLASWLNYWAKRPPRLGAARASAGAHKSGFTRGGGGRGRDGEISCKERRDRTRGTNWEFEITSLPCVRGRTWDLDHS